MAPSDRAQEVRPTEGIVYLVCTSAGEVGVNLSGDHLICDLTTFESMAQRFGRVNRFGDRGDTEIHVVHPATFDDGEPYQKCRHNTLGLLQQLDGDGSPFSLMSLNGEAQATAFAPLPTILPVSDILFDKWSMTTIRQNLPGRPPVEPYLHGIAEREPPETYVAWRQEVSVILESSEWHDRLEDLLESFPLKPHELLRDRTDRILKRLDAIAKSRENPVPVWVVDQQGHIEPLSLVELVEKKDARERIQYCTVLLPPEAGGLDENGFLSPDSISANDVADEWLDEDDKPRRLRISSDALRPDKMEGMRLVVEIDTQAGEDEQEGTEPGGAERRPPERRYWRWYVRPRSADDDASKTALQEIRLSAHTNQVGEYARRIGAALDLPGDMQVALELAGRFHDLGKRRELWQRSIGNPQPTEWYAKSGRDWKPMDITSYRHEFGSLFDVHLEDEFQILSADLKDLVLHLIAAHHGRARPHFPADELLDPDPKQNQPAIEALAVEVPRRFARLQRKYGRWGLAYLESMLRAADWAASNKPLAAAASER